MPLHLRIPGTGVVMAALPDGVPPVVVHLVERTNVLHEKVVLLTIVTAHVPFTDPSRRAKIVPLGDGFIRIVGTYGFMETPDVPEMLKRLEADSAIDVSVGDATYFLGRETILALPGGRMGHTEESLFAALARNSRHAGQYFNLPPTQVIEIGVQIDL
jgi:KUP system potassium uptake protein